MHHTAGLSPLSPLIVVCLWSGPNEATSHSGLMLNLFACPVGNRETSVANVKEWLSSIAEGRSPRLSKRPTNFLEDTRPGTFAPKQYLKFIFSRVNGSMHYVFFAVWEPKAGFDNFASKVMKTTQARR